MKEVLRSIEGVEIFPVISFIIFGLFFVGLLFYIVGFKKEFITEMKNAPLRDEQTNETRKESNHE